MFDFIKNNFKTLALGVWALSFLDAVMTLVGIDIGYATEANPLMAYLISLGPGIFICAKQTLVGLMLFVINKYKESVVSQVGMAISSFLYSVIAISHIVAYSVYLVVYS